MPLDYREMNGYPQESRDLTRFSAVRKILCDWNDRTALRELFINHPGHLYPYASSMNARVVSVGITGYGKIQQDDLGADLAWYEKAMLTVKYESPQYGDAQPYPAAISPALHDDPSASISETLEPYAEASKLDYEKFVWNDASALAYEESPVRLVYRLKYILTRHNLPFVPPTVMSMIGKINNAAVSPILMPYITFPAHTLLFEPATISITKLDNGDNGFDVTYRMLYKEEGWRKYWRVDPDQTGGGSYQTIHHNNEQMDPYEMPDEAGFSVLFPTPP